MKILTIIGGSVVGLVVIGVLALGFLGFVPGLSDLLGTNKPRDLGVRYTDADYLSALAKIPGHTITNAEDVCITCPFVSRGSVPVDSTFTQAEFTAHLNKLNSKKGPLRDVQVKFNADGTVETSGLMKDPRLTAPVYVKGRLVSTSDRGVTLDVQSVEVGRLGVGSSEAEQAEQLANQAVANFFNQNSGMSVESLQVQDGHMKFKGTFPAEIIGDPNAQPASIG